jgi:hypothetical protein
VSLSSFIGSFVVPQGGRATYKVEEERCPKMTMFITTHIRGSSELGPSNRLTAAAGQIRAPNSVLKVSTEEANYCKDCTMTDKGKFDKVGWE